mgnify:CR=1 FL=1|nr:MAG TPA_asm: Prefoldin subunit [Caudoviricetes sp.]
MDAIELLIKRVESLNAVVSRLVSAIVDIQKKMNELEHKSVNLEERNVIYVDFKKKKNIDEL